MTFSRVTKMATAVALVLGMSAASTMANAGPRYSYDQYNNRRYGNYGGYPYSPYGSSYYGYGNSFGSYYDYLSPGYQYYGS